MKKIISLFIISFLCVANSVVKADDDSFIANWQLPTYFGFPWASAPTSPTQKQIQAVPAPAEFDAENCDFDAVWANSSSENIISNAVNNPTSDKGVDDFSGSFKVLYDEDNMYVMLKYTDDDVVGTENVEFMWAPYYKIQAIETRFADIAATSAIQYCRYAAFGAYKATFSSVKYNSSMMVVFDQASGVGNVEWGGTNPILDGNLGMKSYTAVGSKTIKVIYTLGYGVFTGAARPDFNTTIWSQLNDGKGISFDIKVTDNDADDVEDKDKNKLPTSYWWNSTDNNGYAITCFSGFVGLPTNATKETAFVNSVFEKITNNQIILSKKTNLVILNAQGKEIISQFNTASIDISSLGKGIFIIKADNEIKKIIR